MSIATNKGADQPVFVRFLDSRISTHIKASLIMLNPECQWCSLILWLRRLVLILPGRSGYPEDTNLHGMAQFQVDYIEQRGD